MNLEEFEPRAAEAETFMKAIANRHRLMVLCEMHQGEQSVGALQGAIGLSQSALSQHLARLRNDGLVSTRRDAQTIYYSIADPNVSRLIGLLYEIFCVRDSVKASKGMSQ
jgi:DNA-binding transcriptional ArsR family regulator